MQRKFTLMIGWTLLAASMSHAQSPSSARPTRPDRGFYPNGSFSPSEFDTVNNVNGNIIARVPITSLPPGRGGAQLGVTLTYNSAIYDSKSTPRTVAATNAPYVSQELHKSEHGGWQLGYRYGLEYENRGGHGGVCSAINQEVYRVHKMYLRTPDGSLHTLRLHPYADVQGDGFYGIGPNKERVCDSLNPDTAPSGDLVYTTTDGSYIRVELSYSSLLPGCTLASNSSDYWTCRLWRVFLPDGSEVRGYGKRTITFIDRNGNEAYLSSHFSPAGNVVDLIEDQLGRSIEIEKYTDPRKDVIRRLGYGQQLLQWEIEYQTIQSVSGVLYQCANNIPEPYCTMGVVAESTFHEVVSKIKFPSQTVNGSNYSFDFEYAVAAQNGWGELRTVYFPIRTQGGSNTRASLTFEYLWDNYTITTLGQTSTSPVRDVTFRLENPVKKRTLAYTGGDGISRSEVWDYAFTDTSSITTLPDGSTHSASFYDVMLPWRWDRGLVYAESMPLGRSITRSWQRNPPLAPIDANAPSNAFTSSESTTLGTRNSQAKTVTRTFTIDRNGNQTVVADSDWFNGALRTTQSVYLDSVTNATGAAPTVDEVNAYWRAGSRRSVRAVKRQRMMDAGSVTRSLAEFTHDANWNVTHARSWDSTKAPTAPVEGAGTLLSSGNSVLQQSSFSSNGNQSAAFDANGNQATFSYGSISGCSPTQPTVSDLYPTARVEAANAPAIQRAFTLAYDCNTGVVTSETDTNNAVTSTRAYDAFGRPILAIAPDNSWTEWVYQDGNYRTAEYHDVFASADKKNATVRHFDDLGRLFLEQTTAAQDIAGSGATAVPSLGESAPVNGILVSRLYAPPCRTPTAICDNYRYEAVSTPYRTGGADPRGWTRTKYDALGRPIEVRYFTGVAKPFPWVENNGMHSGAELISYLADQTTSTDPVGRTRSSEVDGFGRLVRVTEDAAAGGANHVTLYEYDILDHLKKVTQGGRLRDFEYTSLSRLKSATQPETGPIQYTYDNHGNLLTRGDGRGTMTVGGYDALNRIQSKSWTVANTPAVQYSYDNCPYGKGRLCGVTATGVGGSSFEYDGLGRPVKKTQIIGGSPYVTHQAYLLSGAVAWMTYPTGTVALPRKVSYEYWPNGQLKGVWQGETVTGSLYARVSEYHAAGNEKRVELGNGLLEDTALNARLQIAGRVLTHPGPTAKVLWSAGYDYQNGSPVNDGNVKVQTITGWQAGQSLSFAQTYTYDNLSRLRTVKDSGLSCGPDAQTSQKFVYDRYGNKAVLASSCGESSGAAVPFVANDLASEVEALFPGNRLSNSNPDGSGNQQNWAGKTFTYDGENRLYQANVSGTEFYRYSYDGEGRRVKSQRFETPAVAKESTYYLYDVSGQLIAETDGVTGLGANPERKYLTADHLGSTRLMTRSTGTADTIVASRYDYFPFGEEIARGTLGYGAAAVRPKFTGKERDAETGLDYFGARYFSGAQGRFTSPDPHNPMMIAQMATAAGLPSEAARSQMNEFLENPQNWNKYTYALNNPLRFVDPFGEAPVDGHHLIPARQGLTGLAAEFTNAVKAGADGVGYPNQPGFNGMHRAYNAAADQILQGFEKKFGASRNSWSLSQWRQAANGILNSNNNAIRDFLDLLNKNNAGKTIPALAAAINAYRPSAALIAATAGESLLNLLRMPLIIMVDPALTNPKKREVVTGCLIDEATGKCTI